LTLNGQANPGLMIVRKAAGKWASIWFRQWQHALGKTDQDCGVLFHAGLGRKCRLLRRRLVLRARATTIPTAAESHPPKVKNEFIWAMKPFEPFAPVT